jgi:small subunit ribosomal protein S11
MSDEKKQLEKKDIPAEAPVVKTETPVVKADLAETPDEESVEIQTDLDKEDREELARGFSMDAADEELPEEIKQKLEKNKQARAKKKLVKKRKKKTDKVVKIGRAYINATYNNTMISLTDLNGDVISWASAGMAGFKGAKKATPYAAQIITKIATLKAKEEYGLESVKVFVSGVGTGREGAIRALNANGIEIESIKDITAVPHNGCRPKKPRRV